MNIPNTINFNVPHDISLIFNEFVVYHTHAAHDSSTYIDSCNEKTINRYARIGRNTRIKRSEYVALIFKHLMYNFILAFYQCLICGNLFFLGPLFGTIFIQIALVYLINGHLIKRFKN